MRIYDEFGRGRNARPRPFSLVYDFIGRTPFRLSLGRLLPSRACVRLAESLRTCRKLAWWHEGGRVIRVCCAARRAVKARCRFGCVESGSQMRGAFSISCCHSKQVSECLNDSMRNRNFVGVDSAECLLKLALESCHKAGFSREGLLKLCQCGGFGCGVCLPVWRDHHRRPGPQFSEVEAEPLGPPVGGALGDRADSGSTGLRERVSFWKREQGGDQIGHQFRADCRAGNDVTPVDGKGATASGMVPAVRAKEPQCPRPILNVGIR